MTRETRVSRDAVCHPNTSLPLNIVRTRRCARHGTQVDSTCVGFRHDVVQRLRTAVSRLEDEVEHIGRFAFRRVHVDHFGVHARLYLIAFDVHDHAREKQKRTDLDGTLKHDVVDGQCTQRLFAKQRNDDDVIEGNLIGAFSFSRE